MSAAEAAATTQRIRAALAQAPSKMTMQIARELEVPEADVIRQLPDGRAVELDSGRWEELLRAFEAFGNVHVIVTNGAATLESVGRFGNFSTWGEFFNVQTKTLDMHIRWPNLGAVFAVEKPSHMSGINTLSFQFYDKAGQAAFKVFLTFGSTAPEASLLAQFQEIREKYRKVRHDES
jgi:putative heme utilization carrier protein HutX